MSDFCILSGKLELCLSGVFRQINWSKAVQGIHLTHEDAYPPACAIFITGEAWLQWFIEKIISGNASSSSLNPFHLCRNDWKPILSAGQTSRAAGEECATLYKVDLSEPQHSTIACMSSKSFKTLLLEMKFSLSG